jgi:hypothetical protein
MEDSSPQPEAGSPGDEATEPAPPEGEYRAPLPWVPLAVLAVILFIASPLLLSGTLTEWLRELLGSSPAGGWGHLALVVWAGLILIIPILGFLPWLLAPKMARWDETGVEFTWWLGSSRFYPWDELVAVKLVPRWTERAEDRTFVITASGAKIEISALGGNSEAFIAAANAHIASETALTGE